MIPELGPLEFAIVGEPTLMQLAIAERGLMVIDCTAHGKAGHAAREEGDNAIYKAMQDIEWFRTYRFPKVSDLFGAVKMSVTIISAGTQHNVVPAECRFTVDIRVTDRYTNEEVLEIIKEHVSCEVKARSTRLRPSSIRPDHPIVQAGLALGRTTYGSPTTSDQALLDIPSLKLGVGDSARSHSRRIRPFERNPRRDRTVYKDVIRDIVTNPTTPTKRIGQNLKFGRMKKTDSDCRRRARRCSMYGHRRTEIPARSGRYGGARRKTAERS